MILWGVAGGCLETELGKMLLSRQYLGHWNLTIRDIKIIKMDLEQHFEFRNFHLIDRYCSPLKSDNGHYTIDNRVGYGYHSITVSRYHYGCFFCFSRSQPPGPTLVPGVYHFVIIHDHLNSPWWSTMQFSSVMVNILYVTNWLAIMLKHNDYKCNKSIKKLKLFLFYW